MPCRQRPPRWMYLIARTPVLWNVTVKRLTLVKGDLYNDLHTLYTTQHQKIARGVCGNCDNSVKWIACMRPGRGNWQKHYCGVIMEAMASQIISLTIVYSTVHSGAYQRKHQNSASLQGLCAGNSPVTSSRICLHLPSAYVTLHERHAVSINRLFVQQRI